MAKSYPGAKARRATHRFVGLPHNCLAHENYTRLTNKAIRLLVDLAFQYNGRNNGDLVAAYSIMEKRGWKSKETLRNAIVELLHYGWITLTRQGGLNKKPNLYALTFKPIDECNGKIDLKATTVAPGNWKSPKPLWTGPSNRRNPSALREKKHKCDNRTC